MTTSLFVTTNVKQLRTGGSFRILLSFFGISWGVCFLNSAIFNSFHNRVEFGTILEGLRNFEGEGLNTPNPPPLGTPLSGSTNVLQNYDYISRGSVCSTKRRCTTELFSEAVQCEKSTERSPLTCNGNTRS